MSLQDTIPSELRDAAYSIVDSLDLPDVVAAGIGSAEEAVDKVAGSARQAAGSARQAAGSARQAAAQASGRGRDLGRRAGHSLEANARPVFASASDAVQSTGKRSGARRSPPSTAARRWGLLLVVVGLLLVGAAVWRGAAGKGIRPTDGESDEVRG